MLDDTAVAFQNALGTRDEERPEEVDVALYGGDVVQGDLDEILNAGVA